MAVDILLLRTRYPHWGAQSGINQVLRHIQPGPFAIDERVVEDSDEQFPIKNERVRTILRWAVQCRGMQWYRLSDLAAEIEVYRRSRRGGVDIVHFLDGEHSAQFFPGLQRRWSRPKVVATYHQPPDRLDTVVIRKVISRLDYVLLVSPDQISYFKDLIAPDRIQVILHGINTEYFRPGGTPKREGKFRCLTVGHCLRDFEAVGKVATALKNHPGIEFHVVTHRDTGLDGLSNVTLHRNLSDGQLLARYQESDLLFLPLIQSTANNALLEGIACGLPVVSTLLPSVKAYLPGGEAVLVKENHPDDLSGALLDLCRDPERRMLMSKFARARAEELDWRNIAPEYEAFYSEIASRIR